ncbi:MAG: hypothetical protein QCI38_04675, partial [Candidatus Thermoplasmatota archaeon]|nr:hypothetical protein [Candidatus Thermoplasmatota archaeon]
GVGTGSFMVVYIMYGMVMVIERPLELGGLGSSPGAADYIVLFILSISYSLVFGAAGIFAGLFAYKQDKEHIMLGTAVFSLYSLAIIPFRAVLFGDLAIWVGSLVAGFFLAIAMFLYAYRSIDSYLPVEMEREMRREARRRHRED